MSIQTTILGAVTASVIIGAVCYVNVKYKMQIHTMLDHLRVLLHAEATIDTPFCIYEEKESTTKDANTSDTNEEQAEVPNK